MDFNLPKLGSGLLNKVADVVKGGAEAVTEGVEAIGAGAEAIGNGVENVFEAVTDAASGAMGGDVHLEAQVGGYGTSKASSSTRTRSSLSL